VIFQLSQSGTIMNSLKFNPPLKANDILVIDGGFSTQLEKYVGDVGSDPLWTARSLVERPEAVQQVHKDFLEAGARVLLTASYQASIQGFATHMGLNQTDAVGAIARSVSLAQAAIDDCGKPRGYVLVGGSVGPFGACQHDGSEYTGVYLDAMSCEELTAWHLPRVAALVQAGADFIAAETLPCWREALAVLDAVQSAGGFSPVWTSFSLRDEEHLASGQTIQEAVKQLRKHPLCSRGRLIAVGFNCCDPSAVLGAVEQVRKVSVDMPVVVYPNSGETWDGEQHSWRGQTADLTAAQLTDWLRLGVVGVGGCCRVDASQVARIKSALVKSLQTTYA
jgi:homocysteine S-methyltransferase